MKKIILILSLALACACTKTSFGEAEALLSVDALELTEARSEGRDTLYITTNRSWSAHLTEPSEWISLEKEGGENMAQISRLYALPIEVKANDGMDERSATIRITCGEEGLSKTVTIKQQ